MIVAGTPYGDCWGHDSRRQIDPHMHKKIFDYKHKIITNSNANGEQHDVARTKPSN
jgi:hypothetical protein